MIKTVETNEQIDNLVLAKAALENYKLIINNTTKVYDFELLKLVLDYISGVELDDNQKIQISDFIDKYAPEEEKEINIHGQNGQLDNLLYTFKRKLPISIAKPAFKRAQGTFSTMYTIARKTDKQVPITIAVKPEAPSVHYQYIMKQNTRKAA